MSLEIWKKKGNAAILEKKNIERRSKRDNRKQKRKKCNSKVKRRGERRQKKERERELQMELHWGNKELRSPAAALMLLCQIKGNCA